MAFSEKPHEFAPVIPVKSVSRRRLMVGLAGSGTLALFGGITLRNIWPSLMSQWTTRPLGIKSSLSMAWNADLTRVAVTPDDDSSTTLLWDYEQQRLIGTLHTSTSNIIPDLCLAWSPDGKRVLQVTSDGGQNNITCWDVRTQQTIYASHSTSVSDAWRLYYSPDGRLAAVIGDGSCVVLDANNGKEWIVPSLDRETPTAVAWSPTGTYVAFLLGSKSSGEMALAIWDTWTRQQVTRLIQTSVTYDSYDDLAALAWFPPGNQLMIAASKRLWLVSMNNAQIPLTRFTGDTNFYILDVSPDASTLAVLDSDRIALWDIRTHQRTKVFFRGNNPSWVEAMKWVNASQIAIIDGSYNRVLLQR